MSQFRSSCPVVSGPRRLVLSSVSDYFAAMFTSDVREAKEDEVKMEGVDPDALWVLVQYAYTGKRAPASCRRCLEVPEGPAGLLPTQPNPTQPTNPLPTSRPLWCRRPPGAEGGHHRVAAVGLLPAAALRRGPGLLLLPHEAAPPLQLPGHPLLRRRPGLPRPAEGRPHLHHGGSLRPSNHVEAIKPPAFSPFHHCWGVGRR